MTLKMLAGRRGRTVNWLRRTRRVAAATAPDRYAVSLRAYEEVLRATGWDLAAANDRLDTLGSRVVDQEDVPSADTPSREQARELAGLESVTTRARIFDRIKDDGGWAKHSPADVARIRAEEEARQRAISAHQEDFGAVVGVRATAAKLRKVPVLDLYKRRCTGWGDAEALRWLQGIRADAMFIALEANAALREIGDESVPVFPTDEGGEPSPPAA